MNNQKNTSVNLQLEAHCRKQEYEAATTLFIEQYGGEIFSFLVSRLRRDVDGAAEVFSLFSEHLWSGLPGFQWRTSMRSWAYAIARNAAHHYCCAENRRRDRNTTFDSQSGRFARVTERLRSATKKYLRTEVKDRMRELRLMLPDDDQTLLFLRIDRQMSWHELAMIMSGVGEELEEPDIVQWSSRLRKRFQRVKARLRMLAVAEGLLESAKQ